MEQRPMQRGATLPNRVLLGVEPCPGGWLDIPGKLQGISVFAQEPEMFPRFTDVLDYKPAPAVTAVHIPIGLLSTPVKGGRPCDREARALLGWPRGTAVQSAPTRAAVLAGSYEQARAANGDRLNAVTWRQMARIREAAVEM